MCTEPLYGIRLKTEYDLKFKRFGKRSQLQVLCAVRDIGKDVDKLNYDRSKYDLLMVSCGQCMQCRLQRVKQRAVMSICESLEHEQNSFVTLTFGYASTFQQYKNKGFSNYISRKKAHFHEWSLETLTFKNFMKRLRFWYYNYQLRDYLLSNGYSSLVYKKNGELKNRIRIPKDMKFILDDFKPKKIRCLHCGEYGDRKFRPHHHAILFGFQFPDLVPIWENGQKYYTSKILSKLWPYGIHRIGECTYNSCAYVSRYVTKKVNGNNQEEYYNGRKPEYVTYSTKPVIGSNYFVKNYKEIVTTQELTVVADKKYTCRMPKSFDNILKKIDIDLYNSMKEKRVTECKTDLDRLLSSKRSIYSKLDDNSKICMSTLRKLVRGYEKTSPDYDEYLKKAKAFGLSTKYFEKEFAERGFKFLLGKDYKSHISKSSNQDILDKYYKFELARKRHINACYQLHHSDKTIINNLCMYINMPNPYKCAVRGRLIPDIESLDFDSYIDENGKEINL